MDLLDIPVPPLALLLSALGSYAGQVVAGLAGWPLWAKVAATLLPWGPLFVRGVAHTGRTSGWFALYTVLVVSQTGHVFEHVAQMVQLHVLHLDAAHAQGIFGALNIEWVHFLWNTWILGAVMILLIRFRDNPWLWATSVVAGWHELEHALILSTYLTTGVAGTPGLLAAAGRIGGGLPISRPDLHFLYNLIETAPLMAGFIFEVGRSYEPAPSGAPEFEPEPAAKGEIVVGRGARARHNAARARAGRARPAQGGPP